MQLPAGSVQVFDGSDVPAAPTQPLRAHRLTTAQADIRSKDELLRMHCVAFELREGDTLVFIDYPGIGPSGKTPVDCGGVPFHSQEFRVHSEKLLATGSSKFAEMLQPGYQFRVQRRRKIANKLPEGVKYVLDLTPPSEGDDMVFQMTELSLTPGIIKWWLSYASHSVDFYLVKGHDDCCVCPKVLSSKEPVREPERAEHDIYLDRRNNKKKGFVVKLPPNPRELCELKQSGQRSVTSSPEYYRIPDYCPIRHRNNIMRLLMLIEGKEVTLDSAARMWTLVALSKIWECTSVVASTVSQWLLHGNNSRFIEVLPEESLKIGFALENAQITQCAFQILVTEMAIEEAATPGSEQSHDPTHVTIFGRKKGDVGDELKNLVQHAARALVDRVSRVMARLLHANLFDDWGLPEWDRLTALHEALDGESDMDAKIAFEATKKMRQFIRKIVSCDIKDVLIPSGLPCQESYFTINADRASYAEPEDYEMCEDIVKRLNPVQRLLTPFPYRELHKIWDKSLFLERCTYLSETYVDGVTTLDTELATALLRLQQKGPSAISPQSWAVIFETNKSSTGLAPYFNRGALELQLLSELQNITICWVRFGVEPHPNITRHLLLMLQQNELKYLPLWAGGDNDGTGGVFEAALPPAELGPCGPGPAYRTGATVPSAPSSLAGSFVDDMRGLDMRGSSTAASVDVQDSISTVFRPDQVIADDKSIASETFTDDQSAYQEARETVPSAEYGFGDQEAADDRFMEESDDDYASTIGADDIDVNDQGSDVQPGHGMASDDEGMSVEGDMVLV